MEIKAKRTGPMFNPVEIKLTLKTQEEVQKFYAIFNNGYIADDFFNEEDSDEIRKALNKVCDECYGVEVYNQFVEICKNRELPVGLPDCYVHQRKCRNA